MEQYIPKSALVADIKRRENICKKVVLDLRTEKNKDYYQGKAEAYKETLDLLDILEVKEVQEEPVSEDLEDAAKNHAVERYRATRDMVLAEKCKWSFKAGAQWQKENLWKSADGDDLPEYDREVIAILDYDFGHYKVVYAHRPNPNGWDGTNIDTGKKEHFEPVIYDKGGWNQPHILYWLDTRLPYEENKIDK